MLHAAEVDSMVYEESLGESCYSLQEEEKSVEIQPVKEQVQF